MCYVWQTRYYTRAVQKQWPRENNNDKMCLRITSARTSEHALTQEHTQAHTHADTLTHTCTGSFYYRPPGSCSLFEAHDPSLGKLHAFSPKRCTMTMHIQHAGECCIFTWTSPPPVLGLLPADVTERCYMSSYTSNVCTQTGRMSDSSQGMYRPYAGDFPC